MGETSVLIESGTIDDAIEVYNKDLSWWPKNGLALHGLKNAYKLKKDLKSFELQVKKRMQGEGAAYEKFLKTKNATGH